MLQTEPITLNCGRVVVTVTGADASEFLQTFFQTALPGATIAAPVAVPDVSADGPWLTLTEVARSLSISPQLAAHWLKREWLPQPTVIAGGKRWNANELQRFLASPALSRAVWRRLYVKAPELVRGAQS